MNSKLILSEETIVIKDVRRSKKLFLEEVRNEEHVFDIITEKVD